MLDEMFKDIHDNWWMAAQPDIQNFQDFKTQFKMKYWLESTQNMVRNNLSNDRYEAYIGQSPTSYFLGKVCMAWNLEPRIPEECLVTQLSYHYEDGITKARLYAQIKTIQDMANLLESYEHEGQYRRNRVVNTKYNRYNDNYHQQNQNTGNSPQTNNHNNQNRNPNNNPNNNQSNNNYRGNNNYNNHDNRTNQGDGDNQNRNYRPNVNYVQSGPQGTQRRYYPCLLYTSRCV